MTIDFVALERDFENKRKDWMKKQMVYMNTKPISDPMEALMLLYTNPFASAKPGKRLVPRSVTGPRPLGVWHEYVQALPFIEHTYSGGRYDCELAGATDWLVSFEVAGELQKNGWVEEAEMGYCKISPVGITVLNNHHKSSAV